MNLAGSRILVVEDDTVIASEICADLHEAGARVLGPAPTSHYAYNLLMGRGVDGAVLDVRLHGTDVFDLAGELADRGVPMVFATGYAGDIPVMFRKVPLLPKPFSSDHLIKIVDAALKDRRQRSEMTKADPAQPQGNAVSLSSGPTHSRPALSWEDRFIDAVARAMKPGSI